MPDPADRLFPLPGMHVLLGDELRLASELALRQPAGRALLLHPRGESSAVGLHGLRGTHVHCAGDLLDGDVRCSAHALPFEDDAFRLVVAQHVADNLPEATRLVGELARILAAGGELLWFGLNPWNARSLSQRLPARAGDPGHAPLGARRLRLLLERAGLGAFRVRGLGGIWSQAVVDRGPRWLDPLRGAYLLVAHKQVVTPLHVPSRTAARRLRGAPQFAGTPSRRACA
jgi:SAM-dependent methyltransferase